MGVKAKRKYLINAAIILVITGLTVFYLFKSKTVTVEDVRAIPWYSYAACFALFLLALAFLSVSETLIYRSFTDEMNYLKCFADVNCGNLGSGITPFRSGHFPLMAYYHYKANVSAGTTLTGFLKCQIIYSAVSIFVYLIITVYLAVTGITAEIGGITVSLWTVVCVGFGFHAVVFAAVVVLAYSRKFQRGTLKLAAWIATKFKKSFDGEKFYAEQTEKLDRFKEQISVIGKLFYKYFAPAFAYAANMFVSGGVCYVAYLLVSGESFALSGFFTFYILNLASEYITNVIPLPGAAGTAEALFLLVFSSLLADPLLGKTLVVWRVSTYYIPVVAEFLLFLSVSVRKRKRESGFLPATVNGEETENG